MLPNFIIQFLMYTLSMNCNGQCTQNTCEVSSKTELEEPSSLGKATKISCILLEIGFNIRIILCQNGYIISPCTALLGIFQMNNLRGKQERKRVTKKNYQQY